MLVGLKKYFNYYLSIVFLSFLYEAYVYLQVGCRTATMIPTSDVLFTIIMLAVAVGFFFFLRKCDKINE
jgi:hypothetical protein